MNMDWNNYLLEEKSPVANWAHLGTLEGNIRGIYDLSELPKNAKVISLYSPLKKLKLSYQNWDALTGNENIEAISLTDMDEERLCVFATLPNLQYLQIRDNKQEALPNLSCLKALKVLILANLTKVSLLDCVFGMKELKTLYVYGINKLYDLTPLSSLIALQELFLHHGKMSGVGNPVKSMKPLAELLELKYLDFCLRVESKMYDMTPLFGLKKLEYLSLMPRYVEQRQWEQLKSNLPQLNKEWTNFRLLKKTKIQ
jgi:Leucine-rich repeat (LRR) protein